MIKKTTWHLVTTETVDGKCSREKKMIEVNAIMAAWGITMWQITKGEEAVKGYVRKHC